MTGKREPVKMKCPFCSACRRSIFLPEHLIKYHIHEIHLASSGAQPDHCLFAYTCKKTDMNGFYFCFTCKNGIMNIFPDEHRCRWLSKHDKKDSCKKAHSNLLKSFKTEQKRCQVLIRNETDSILDVSCRTDTIDNLWKSLKNKKQLKNYMNDIEQSCADLYSDESDNYMFNASQGFEDCIANAIGYKKEYETIKNNNIITQLEIAHEKEMIKMRDELSLYKNKSEYFFMAMDEKEAEIAELQAKNQQLIAENKSIKETV